MDKNCLDCLYANYSEIGIMFGKFTDGEHRRCEHPNSPYYRKFVTEKDVCRLLVDEKEYFRNKDLKEKIIHLKNKRK